MKRNVRNVSFQESAVQVIDVHAISLPVGATSGKTRAALGKLGTKRERRFSGIAGGGEKDEELYIGERVHRRKAKREYGMKKSMCYEDRSRPIAHTASFLFWLFDAPSPSENGPVCIL